MRHSDRGRPFSLSWSEWNMRRRRRRRRRDATKNDRAASLGGRERAKRKRHVYRRKGRRPPTTNALSRTQQAFFFPFFCGDTTSTRGQTHSACSRGRSGQLNELSLFLLLFDETRHARASEKATPASVDWKRRQGKAEKRKFN